MQTKMNMTPQEIAKSIADELRAHPERWIQNAAKRGNCRCLGQHIEQRSKDRPSLDVEKVFAIAAGLKPVTQMSIILWNDHPDRTVGDIIALCEKVSQS